MSVVIPAKNEARNLPGVLAELPPGLHEVILVDGASADSTVATARRLRPDIVVVHQTRRGKGNALACGFAACTGDVIVMLDADGSADPAEIPAFVAALVAGCDFAKGSRFLNGGGSDDLTPLRRLGNRVLAVTMNTLYRTSYSDLCYGYNAFWNRCLDQLELPPVDGPAPGVGDGFEIETSAGRPRGVRQPQGHRGAVVRAGALVRPEPPQHVVRRLAGPCTILREKWSAAARTRLRTRQEQLGHPVEAAK